MTTRRDDALLARSLSRRGVLRGAAGATGALTVGGATHSALGAPNVSRSMSSRAQDGAIIFTSTQLTPIEEQEAMRNTILADFEGQVEFINEEAGPFTDRVLAEAESGQGSVSLLGGLHGDLATFVARDLLMDLSELATELEPQGFIPAYTDLATYGTPGVAYIPWMQATYIMAAHRDALEFLPEGVTEETLSTDLTYDLLGQWASSINDNMGQMLGFPAADDGLIHRFFQGYSYPSFTGGVNTTFADESAVAMWEWFRQAWSFTNPQALTYSNMDQPLLSGEVVLAWDHVARLITALTEDPDNFVTFPAPRGPEGLGFMPVVAGLAIPKSAPDPEGAMNLIRHLTQPEVQLTTLREVAFFPVLDLEYPDDLSPGILLESSAVQATTSAPDAVESVLPIGLGEQGGAYNTVFRNVFRGVAIDGGDIQQVLQAEAAKLQEVLNTANASCWAPDPESEGVCQVGGGGGGTPVASPPA
ncbi:MAG: carbohydrate ABC transporter substrate-binding protein [Chloroflexia bacterium]|nr:carbohydrate ABC transporter substrate-binding protein [Chloroflexia bacterium]